MSTKKSKNSSRQKPFVKSDFKKLSPSELEKLGYSKKAERFLAPKNYTGKVDVNGTISKRAQAQSLFNITLEEKAKKIKSGERKLNPKSNIKARQGRIEQASKRREQGLTKQKPSKLKSIKVRYLKDGKNRYDYALSTYMILAAYSGNDEALDRVLSDLNQIFLKHPRDDSSFYRFLFLQDEKIRSTPIYFLSEGGDNALERLLEEIAKGHISGVNLLEKDLKIELRIYAI